MQFAQGRRKLVKVGGAGFEGHFSNKKGDLKIFSRKCFRTYLKNFQDYDIFLENDKNFPEIT